MGKGSFTKTKDFLTSLKTKKIFIICFLHLLHHDEHDDDDGKHHDVKGWESSSVPV